MVEIKLAKTAGFCWGVKRAIDVTMNVAEGKESATYTLGPLIHNPQLIALLESKKIHAAGDVGDIKGSEVIVRTHGITPETREQIKSAGIKIHDATCPLVAKVQGTIKKYTSRGYAILIFGDDGHAEIVGLKGYAKTAVHVISSIADISALPDYDKVLLVGQTTCDRDKYLEVSRSLRKRYENLEVGETICDATNERQEEVIRLSKEVDAMVVVGGMNSANTKRLALIAEERGIPTYHVETDDELDLDVLREYGTIGVTAGASTPNWMLDRVIGTLKTVRPEKETSLSYLESAVIFAIKSNLYLAFGAMALALANMIIMGIRPSIPTLLIPFCAILTTYQVGQLMRSKEENRGRAQRYLYHMKYPRTLWTMAIASAMLGLLQSLSLGFNVAAIFVGVIFFGATYELGGSPVKKLFSAGGMKNMPASKDLFVSFAWVMVTVVIPYLSVKEETGFFLPLTFTFGIAYARRVLLGLRDIHGDQIVGRDATATVVGKEKTFYMLYGLVIFLAGLLFVNYLTGRTGADVFGMVVGLLYLYVFILYDQTKVWVHSSKFEFFLDAQFLLIGASVLLIHLL